MGGLCQYGICHMAPAHALDSLCRVVSTRIRGLRKAFSFLCSVPTQRKAELKRNAKREQREQQKRAALAGLEASAASGGAVGPGQRAGPGRPKLNKSATDLAAVSAAAASRGGTPGGLGAGEGGEGGAGAGSVDRDLTPGTEVSCEELGPADLVDPLAHRWVVLAGVLAAGGVDGVGGY